MLFESVLFEPRAFAPACTSVEAIPLDRSRPDAAQRALGSPLGVLAFELQQHPDSVMLPLLTLVRDAANLCIGRAHWVLRCCRVWSGLLEQCLVLKCGDTSRIGLVLKLCVDSWVCRDCSVGMSS